MNQPLPDSGWSRSTLTIENALVCPPTSEGKLHQDCGVFAAGRDIAEAAIWRYDKRMTMPVREPPTTPEPLPGTHIYGGMIYGHFGHFIAETLSRAWAIRKVKAESVILIPKHGLLTEVKGYQKDLFQMFGGDIPVNITQKPLVVENLIIPGQGFGLGEISRATPEFKEMLRETTEGITPAGVQKIYISRTRFGGRGGIINEAILDENFAALGYTVLHPQRMSVREQLAHYKAATHIVGLDSSAFHLLGFVARPEQKVCIILRRNARAYQHIALQLEGMLKRPPIIINALDADWMPEQQTFANHLSWGELNHHDLAIQLAQADLIDSASTWRVPETMVPAEALAAAEQVSKSPLIRRVIDTRLVA